MTRIRPKAGVIGSGTQAYSELALPLGQWLAEQGFDLVTGGGGGVMEAVARGFSQVAERPGQILGILPSTEACTTPEERGRYSNPSGYPNGFVEVSIRTHLHLSGIAGKDTASRNHIVVLTADIVIALPGAEGTRSEIQLALEYQKPLVILNPMGQWNEFQNTQAHLCDSLDAALNTLRQLVRTSKPGAHG